MHGKKNEIYAYNGEENVSMRGIAQLEALDYSK